MSTANLKTKQFLFLQGPISPLFRKTAAILKRHGHFVLRVNLCFGDKLLWGNDLDSVDFHGKMADFGEYIANIIKAHDITDLVLISEQRSYHKIAIEQAKKNGVQVIVTDLGYLRPDWITLELNGISRESLFPKDPEIIKVMAKNLPYPNMTQIYVDKFWYDVSLDMMYHISTILLKFKFPFYKTYLVYHPIINYLGVLRHIILRKFSTKKTANLIDNLILKKIDYFVLAMQLEQDYQIREYSPYESQLEVLDEVIQSFSMYIKTTNNSSKLIIKIHPLDPLLINWKKKVRDIADKFDVTKNVIVILGGDLTLLLKYSRGLIVVNSSVGVRAIMLGVPVLTLGDALYNIEGLVTTKDDLATFWLEYKAAEPELRDAFIKLLSSTIQIKGGYYNKPGIDNAAKIAAYRLEHGLVNQIIN